MKKSRFQAMKAPDLQKFADNKAYLAARGGRGQKVTFRP